jgi:glycosyltransferase involved in cell wall biosynthesis
MAYYITEIDLAHPVRGLTVPQGHDGIALVLRHNDVPVAFLMHAFAPGASLPSEELASLIQKNAELASAYSDADPSNLPPLPPLTVAICTRNRSELLERCLHHLLKLRAGGPQFEILVADNAPVHSSTRELVESLDSVSYVCEPKPGLDFARNSAIRASRTELLAYIDDDAVADRFWVKGIQRALAENPDAGALTGPTLPLELVTEPQVMLEWRGGFGHYFSKRRIENFSHPYPYGFGAGCNMIFRREALVKVSGFDEALDNDHINGGGDTDIFYRIVRAGYPVVVDPAILVFHQHRREHKALRRQMEMWGVNSMALMTKTLRRGPDRLHALAYIYRYLRMLFFELLLPACKRTPPRWPRDLLWAELRGSSLGLFGAYGRSQRHVARVRAMHSDGDFGI